MMLRQPSLSGAFRSPARSTDVCAERLLYRRLVIESKLKRVPHVLSSRLPHTHQRGQKDVSRMCNRAPMKDAAAASDFRSGG
jgi:hypothetical protein